jgi:hypothetical protein
MESEIQHIVSMVDFIEKTLNHIVDANEKMKRLNEISDSN